MAAARGISYTPAQRGVLRVIVTAPQVMSPDPGLNLGKATLNCRSGRYADAEARRCGGAPSDRYT